MSPNEQKQKVLAKLASARNELEDALNLPIASARYDPVVLTDARRRALSVMLDVLSG
jgi:hypothetical protein